MPGRNAMRTPERRRVRALALRLALFFVLVAALSCRGAFAFDLDELMAGLATVRSAQATFVERRTVQELDRTLESSGRLTYQAPDHFTRETLSPHHDKLDVSGNVVTMTRGDRTRSFALDASPEAQLMVEAIRGTLGGNRALLERLFELRLDGSAGAWDLLMVPRDARLRGQVADLRISGRGDEIRRVIVTLADGDRSTMQLESVLERAR
jgi:hypothetical protein